MDQFESSANFNAHYYETGPEVSLCIGLYRIGYQLLRKT